jgi:hypothetical protein
MRDEEGKKGRGGEGEGGEESVCWMNKNGRK